MSSCSVCSESISTQEIRQGAAISSGTEVYHRDCHRAIRNSGGGGSAAPPAAAPMATAGEYASFWRRLGAHVIDGLILNLVVGAMSFGIGLAMGFGGGMEVANLAGVIGGGIGLLFPLVYYAWFWSKKGASPGKAMLGIAIVSADGSVPTMGQSIVRYLGYIPSSLVFCLGFLWMCWDPEKQTWHDKIAGTRVVRI